MTHYFTELQKEKLTELGFKQVVFQHDGISYPQQSFCELIFDNINTYFSVMIYSYIVEERKIYSFTYFAPRKNIEKNYMNENFEEIIKNIEKHLKEI